MWCPTDHWQPLRSACIMVSICLRSVGHRDVVLDIPRWALPVKKKNYSSQGPFRPEKNIVLVCFQPLTTKWERPTGIGGILVFHFGTWYGLGWIGVTAALPGPCGGIVPAFVSDHTSRQVWDMIIWDSRLSTHQKWQAGERSAGNPGPANNLAEDGEPPRELILTFSNRKSKNGGDVKSRQSQMSM